MNNLNQSDWHFLTVSQVKVIPAAPHSFHPLPFKMPSPQVNARPHPPTAKYGYSFFPASPAIVAGIKSKTGDKHLWCRGHEYVWLYIWFKPEYGLWVDGGISQIFTFPFLHTLQKSDDLKARRNSSLPSVATQRAPDIPHNCPPVQGVHTWHISCLFDTKVVPHLIYMYCLYANNYLSGLFVCSGIIRAFNLYSQSMCPFLNRFSCVYGASTYWQHH